MSDRSVMTNQYVSDVVDLDSPDDIALADRMKVGRQQILTELRKIKPEKLVRRRADKYAAMGSFTEA